MSNKNKRKKFLWFFVNLLIFLAKKVWEGFFNSLSFLGKKVLDFCFNTLTGRLGTIGFIIGGFIIGGSIGIAGFGDAIGVWLGFVGAFFGLFLGLAIENYRKK